VAAVVTGGGVDGDHCGGDKVEWSTSMASLRRPWW